MTAQKPKYVKYRSKYWQHIFKIFDGKGDKKEITPINKMFPKTKSFKRIIILSQLRTLFN